MLATATFDKNAPPAYEQTIKASGNEPLVLESDDKKTQSAAQAVFEKSDEETDSIKVFSPLAKAFLSDEKKIQSIVEAVFEQRDKEKASIKFFSPIFNGFLTGGMIAIGTQVGATIRENPIYATLVAVGSMDVLFTITTLLRFCLYHYQKQTAKQSAGP